MEKTIICHSNDAKFQSGFEAALKYLYEVRAIEGYSKKDQIYKVKPTTVILTELANEFDDSFEY
jgi:hypothetical protein